jgi:hypothetical protein
MMSMDIALKAWRSIRPMIIVKSYIPSPERSLPRPFLSEMPL